MFCVLLLIFNSIVLLDVLKSVMLILLSAELFNKVGLLFTFKYNSATLKTLSGEKALSLGCLKNLVHTPAVPSLERLGLPYPLLILYYYLRKKYIILVM